MAPVRQVLPTVVISNQVFKSTPVPPDTTFHKKELMDLTRTLTLTQGKGINIYRNSKCAFYILHHYTSIWQEKNVLTNKGTLITSGPLILKLLEASYFSEQVTVVHWVGHPTPTNDIVKCIY